MDDIIHFDEESPWREVVHDRTSRPRDAHPRVNIGLKTLAEQVRVTDADNRLHIAWIDQASEIDASHVDTDGLLHILVSHTSVDLEEQRIVDRRVITFNKCSEDAKGVDRITSLTSMPKTDDDGVYEFANISGIFGLSPYLIERTPYEFLAGQSDMIDQTADIVVHNLGAEEQYEPRTLARGAISAHPRMDGLLDVVILYERFRQLLVPQGRPEFGGVYQPADSEQSVIGAKAIMDDLQTNPDNSANVTIDGIIRANTLQFPRYVLTMDGEGNIGEARRLRPGQDYSAK